MVGRVYPWLIWSPSRHGAYCKFCALFARLPEGKSHGGGFLGKLVTMPFQNFKNAKGKDGILDTHANYHAVSQRCCSSVRKGIYTAIMMIQIHV